LNIILDLDGTLIDSKSRLYHLFQYLAPVSSLSYEQYWAFKQKKISNETLLSSHIGYDKDEIAGFLTQWMALIESPPYLSLDSNLAGIETALAGLQQVANLYVCTARQLHQPVLDQLASLNLLQFFKQVLVTEQKYTKEALIAANVTDLSSQDWMVGDTGKDIQVGKLLNIKTCAVLSGFLSRESLQSYDPDLILDSVIDFQQAVY
jgi:phosphoglycolate phosphatase